VTIVDDDDNTVQMQDTTGATITKVSAV